MQPGVADWIFRSWPALFASALGMWLLQSGPIVNAPRWVQKGVRLAMVFFVYSGFLFLLRWNPFWRGWTHWALRTEIPTWACSFWWRRSSGF
jgi:hypothetical protein